MKFSELVVERYTEDKFDEICGEIVLTEVKDDIYGIRDKVVSEGTKDEIESNKIYSLNGKDYSKKEIVCGEGYELVKLGDICTFLPKSKKKASDGHQVGKYNFYTSSDKVQKCDIVDYNEECLIIGSGGVANIKIDCRFSCSADNIILKTTNNKYIYNLLKGTMNLLSDGFTGSTLKHLSKEYLINLTIPIPKSKEKILEWDSTISIPCDRKKECLILITKLEERIKEKINDIRETEECNEVDFDSLLRYLPKVHKYKAADGFTTGLYKFYTSSQYKILYRDTYEFQDTCILIGIGGNPSIHLTEKFSVSNDVYVFALKDRSDKGFLQYIFNYLKTDMNLISDSFRGSTIKHTSKEGLSKIKIKIPKNNTLLQNLNPLFQEIEKLQSEVVQAEILYNKLIVELSEEALPSNSSVEIVPIQKSKSPENVGKTCQYKYTKGKNANQLCAVKTKENTLYCSSHKKYNTK